MAANLSPTQIRVLTHMERGCVLHTISLMHPTLSGSPKPDFQVYNNTWYSLLCRDLIRREDQEGCPHYRRDYVITDWGIEALRQAGVPKQLPLEEPK